ncbi:putative cytoskeleton assembly control protein sla1p [Diaporthe ampelina]|uniref:Actin cytoskeleton-regulatory complex protein SLA1 n=1 Tax=Diaporthe ampelina TaxID=1214573 RepID=A0A0G2FSI2_9PEZI|nr:putative cytoskeleton assembly control protein sla1p [Diaporthe ampelina]
MGFLGVYRAIYDYAPQSEGELLISEGDLLYLLEQSSEDDWWKVKKKASAEDEDEPVGLVPSNYIEQAQSIASARALYEYTRQTDEELSFTEDAVLEIFDTSDPDWILVGFNGDYGFVPANYIDMADGAAKATVCWWEPRMISIMGKKKKMPTTLGINLKTGIILIAPEHAQDGPSLEWTGDKMTHYSREGKHVFIELVRPSKSVDFHAGAKDTAEEIVAALGELAGAIRAEGLREVIMAGTGREQKKGKMLYDFMAQGEDEVTVADGDEVIVLDDMKSEDWWQVRRVKNGKEGVVPSSYVEITGTAPAQPASMTGVNAGRSTVAQNRLEEERLTKEAVKAARKEEGKRASERKRENGHSGSSTRSSNKSKPDPSKVRTWTDRSKSFSVEAQFLGMKDGKLNLHKVNGVKIAVPVAKMSVEDLEYVERVTGISLDEDKPLSEVKRARSQRQGASAVGASIEQPKKPEYDWFQFFLDYVDASVLRTLGLREGDIIKVMRYLDNNAHTSYDHICGINRKGRRL